MTSWHRYHRKIHQDIHHKPNDTKTTFKLRYNNNVKLGQGKPNYSTLHCIVLNQSPRFHTKILQNSMKLIKNALKNVKFPAQACKKNPIIRLYNHELDNSPKKLLPWNWFEAFLLCSRSAFLILLKRWFDSWFKLKLN